MEQGRKKMVSLEPKEERDTRKKAGIHLKLTQYCKSTILQLIKKKKKKKRRKWPQKDKVYLLNFYTEHLRYRKSDSRD